MAFVLIFLFLSPHSPCRMALSPSSTGSSQPASDSPCPQRPPHPRAPIPVGHPSVSQSATRLPALPPCRPPLPPCPAQPPPPMALPAPMGPQPPSLSPFLPFIFFSYFCLFLIISSFTIPPFSPHPHSSPPAPITVNQFGDDFSKSFTVDPEKIYDILSSLCGSHYEIILQSASGIFFTRQNLMENLPHQYLLKRSHVQMRHISCNCPPVGG